MDRPPGKRPTFSGQGDTALTATGYQAPPTATLLLPPTSRQTTLQCHLSRALPATPAPRLPLGTAGPAGRPGCPTRPPSWSDKAPRSLPSSLPAPSRDPEPSPPQGGPAARPSPARTSAPSEDMLSERTNESSLSSQQPLGSPDQLGRGPSQRSDTGPSDSPPCLVLDATGPGCHTQKKPPELENGKRFHDVRPGETSPFGALWSPRLRDSWNTLLSTFLFFVFILFLKCHTVKLTGLGMQSYAF